MKNIKFIYLIFIILTTNYLYASKSIEIDLSKQKLYAKENGKIVFTGSISSGKSDHPTPRGNFKIIDKERFHISNKYPEPNGGAKMPYMLRLTNYGVAIHQGYLPGYPASHGCIRVSKSTAKKLWRWSKIGTKVKIYGHASNFKYTKKKKKSKTKKRYSKKSKRIKKQIVRKNTYKRYKSNKKIRKKHYVSKQRYYRHRSDSDYEIIEIYDNW